MTDTAPAHAKDNLLGICHAVGEDFGFDPLWLRLVFATTFLFAPAVVVGSYLALGLVVLAARLVFPAARRRPTGAAVPATAG